MARIAAIERNTKRNPNQAHPESGRNRQGSRPYRNRLLRSYAGRLCPVMDFFDLTVEVNGDLQVDTHHTIEDTGIVLGRAIKEAVGDKKGIVRYGSRILPMDEALLLCALDLCGRPYLVYDLQLDREKVGDLETEMIREFFYAVSYGAEMNLHLKQLSGINNHHIIEGAFKVFAKALDEATRYDPRITRCAFYQRKLINITGGKRNMQLYPAIDMKGGKMCPPGPRDIFDNVKVYSDTPAHMAKLWVEQGASFHASGRSGRGHWQAALSTKLPSEPLWNRFPSRYS